MKTNIAFLFSISFFLLTSIDALCQDDIMAILDEEEKNTTVYTYATFKGTRVINGHSVELRKKKELEFLISHRFGPVSGGAYELWGLDEANIRIALEYGVADWFEIGLGRSSFEKTFDGFLKFKMLRQSKGRRKMPLTMDFLTTTNVISLRPGEGETIEFTQRMAFSNTLILARKFSPNISIQLSPMHVHYNVTPVTTDPNDLFALGFTGRFKFTRSIALMIEYFYRFNQWESIQTYDPVGIGLDIETGGHVFQLHFTNARVINEPAFIGRTTDDFFAGDIRFGFNISRTFQLGAKKSKKEKEW